MNSTVFSLTVTPAAEKTQGTFVSVESAVHVSTGCVVNAADLGQRHSVSAALAVVACSDAPFEMRCKGPGPSSALPAPCELPSKSADGMRARFALPTRDAQFTH